MRTPLALSFFCAAVLGAAAHAAPRTDPAGTRSYSPPPERFTTRDGRTWERIPLKYVDAGYIAAILGAPVLPTEADVWALKMRGYGGMGGFPGGGYGGYGSGSYGGFGGGYGGFGGGYQGGYGGFGGSGGSPLGGYAGSGSGMGAFYRAAGSSAVGYLPAGGAGGPGPAAIFGDPNSNSLIVGPGRGGPGAFGQGRGGGSPLFPGLIMLGDRNSNSLLVDP